MIKMYLKPILGLFLWFLLTPVVHGETPRIAVASNFSPAMKFLAEEYKKKTGNPLILAFGSTGKHYAQIRNGAPYDAFFAADVRRPQLLEEAGIGISGSRFTYAIGRLALWSTKTGYVTDRILAMGQFKHIALANPRLAPYGLAAKQYLEKAGLYQGLVSQMVFGENISQTYQFIASGNAELGFIALSQLQQPGKQIPGSWWLVPENMHAPIEQQAILLKDNKQARAFMDFVKSPAAQSIIKRFGYSLWNSQT